MRHFTTDILPFILTIAGIGAIVAIVNGWV